MRRDVASALRESRRVPQKLTEAQVVAIRQMNQDGMTMYRLAKFYGVNFTTIERIVKRRTWKHVA